MPLLHDVAHLGHAELLTPEPEKSLWFFTQVLGLTENGTSGDSVYLRTWDDYEHHSLKLTAVGTRRASAGPGCAPPARRRCTRRVAGSRPRASAWLAGRRRRHRPDLPVPRPGRPRVRAVLGDRVVPRRRRAQARAEEPGAGLPRPRRPRPAARPRQLPGCADRAEREVRCRGTRRPGHRADRARRRHDLRAVAALRAEVLRPRLHQRLDGVERPAAPHRVRHRHQGGRPAGRRHLPRQGCVHRDRAAQARDPADLLPVRLRAGREPDRAVQPVRAADLRAGLGAGQLDGGGAGEGTGMGPCDDPVLPHARHPAGAGIGQGHATCRPTPGARSPGRSARRSCRASSRPGSGWSRSTCASGSARRGSSCAPPCRNCPRRAWWSSSATGAPGCATSRSPRRSRSPRCASCSRAWRRPAPRNGSPVAEAAMLRGIVTDMHAAVSEVRAAALQRPERAAARGDQGHRRARDVGPAAPPAA